MMLVVDMPRAGAYGSTHVTTELYFNESNQVVREAVMSEMGYGGPQATKIVGITYRQLDYWTRTGLVVPSIKSAEGSGTQRVYSFNDLLQLKVIKELIDAGASLQKVRQSIEYVRENIEGDWSKVTIATDGDRVYACTSDAEVLDLLRSGQGVLGSLVSVEKVKEQLDGTLAELRPTAEELTYGSPGHEEELRAKEG